MADRPDGDAPTGDRPSDLLGNLLSDADRTADNHRTVPRPPAFRDRMPAPAPPARSPLAPRTGDAAFRDDRFDDPAEQTYYGGARRDAARLDEARPPTLEDDLRAPDDRPLASPWTRLGAQIVDGLTVAVCFLPFLVLGEDGGMMLAGLAVIALGVYQLLLLAREGQTIGKRAVKVRIVDIEDGTNPGFVRTFLIRGVANALISSIPYLGTLYAIADTLFIFREDRRCIHDHLARTIVVSEAGMASR